MLAFQGVIVSAHSRNELLIHVQVILTLLILVPFLKHHHQVELYISPIILSMSKFVLKQFYI